VSCLSHGQARAGFVHVFTPLAEDVPVTCLIERLLCFATRRLIGACAKGWRGSIAANSTRFGRARSSDEKIVLEPRLKVTVEDSLRHNMRLPFDASVETTKT